MLSFQPPQGRENFMFSSAYGEFRIKDAQFDFSRIALDGPSISLIGNGSIGFLSHALQLQFFTQARSRIPLVKPIIEALGKGWVAVSVQGTIENPVVNQQTQVPIVSDAIRVLMRTVEQQGRPIIRPPTR